MHVMLTNKGPTPLPIGSPDAGGFEGLLPPGLEIAIARDDLSILVFGEQPDAASRNKLHALGREVDPESPLAVEYGTDIDQWKGRSDPGAEQAVMAVWLTVKNVGPDPVTVTTTEGATELARDEAVFIETIAGAAVTGTVVAPPVEDPNLQITAFTAELEPTCTITGRKGLENADTVTLTSTAGNPATRALIDGHSGPVYEVQDYSFRISFLDLTGQDVAGLQASGAMTQVVDTTGTILSFTAANPTEATMDSEDQGMLLIGDFLTLEALTGTPEAMEVVNGLMVEVLSLAPVTLGIDLSLVDVTGLSADFVIG